MKAAVLLIFLVLLSREDIKTQELPQRLLLLAGIAGVGFFFAGSLPGITEDSLPAWVSGPGELLTAGQLLSGVAVGAALFVISLLSCGRIGQGDAVMVLIMGCYFGGFQSLMLLWGASFLAGLYGLFLLLLFHKRKTDRIPFVPFLLASYMVWLGTVNYGV